MATTQYIGARYVPLFYTNPDDNSNNWKSGVVYDPLTIVTDINQSYTSKIPVPASVGRPSENPTYWILTGAYNAQIEEYRQEVEAIQENVEDLGTNLETLEDDVNILHRRSGYGATQIGVYDTAFGVSSGGIQGAFTDGNTWYQYIYQYGGTGKLLAFNMQTGRYIRTINKYLYHGNDFVKVGSVVYGAPYDDGSAGVNKLLRFTVDGEVEELDVFSSTGYDCLYAVDKIDDDTLICALRTYGINAVKTSAFYLYHITANTVEPVPVDWGSMPTSQNWFPHPIVYKNGRLYLSASFENGFYTMEYKNNALKVVAYSAIPIKTAFGFAITELEGFGFVDCYGDNFIVFTSPTDNDAMDILFCAINLTGDSPAFIMDGTSVANTQKELILSYADMDLIFENGSRPFPFKSLERACIAASHNFGGGLPGNVMLPSVVNEPNKDTLDIRAQSFALVGHEGGTTIQQPIKFTRCQCNMGLYPITFAGKLTINAHSDVRMIQGNNNIGEVEINASKFIESKPNHHTGRVVVDGSFYIMSIVPEETPNVVTTNQCIVQVNKTVATGISAGGGATVLTSGVK